MITYPSDIYTLEERQKKAIEEKKGISNGETIILLNETKGWGSKSIEKLYLAIQESKLISCPR